jgi:hypothetical protein
VGSSWSQWLHLITRHTYGYRPQPYQQLAAVRRAAGHDADARDILIAQQQDLRERGELGGRLTRTLHYLWGAMHTAQADNPHGPCSLTEQIEVGIDRGLPLSTTGIRGRCDLDTTSRRQTGQTISWQAPGT